MAAIRLPAGVDVQRDGVVAHERRPRSPGREGPDGEPSPSLARGDQPRAVRAEPQVPDRLEQAGGPAGPGALPAASTRTTPVPAAPARRPARGKARPAAPARRVDPAPTPRPRPRGTPGSGPRASRSRPRARTPGRSGRPGRRPPRHDLAQSFPRTSGRRPVEVELNSTGGSRRSGEADGAKPGDEVGLLRIRRPASTCSSANIVRSSASADFSTATGCCSAA